jgi:hypothetical protein
MHLRRLRRVVQQLHNLGGQAGGQSSLFHQDCLGCDDVTLPGTCDLGFTTIKMVRE